MSELKKGALTLKDRKVISTNIGKKTPEEIARILNRPVKLVDGFIKKQGNDKVGIVAAHTNLRNTPDYELLKKELTSEELKSFEYTYANWVGQLEADITASERSQLFILIKYEILMSKLMIERREIEELLNEVKKDIQDNKDSDLGLEERKKRHEELRKTRVDLGVSRQATIRTLGEIENSHGNLMKMLKGTRDQRIKNIDNRKKGFMDLIKSIQSELERNEIGEDSELNKIAGDKQGEIFSRPHEYLDGQNDLPFISGQTFEVK